MRILSFWIILSSICACNQDMTSNKESDDIYEKLFASHVNVHERIKDSMNKKGEANYRIFPKLIKSGILASIVKSDSRDDKSDFYFLIYNLKEDKILWLVSNPFSDIRFQEIEYDYDNNLLIAYPQKGLSQILSYNCVDKAIATIPISDQELSFDPGSVVLSKNLAYFTQSPLGSFVYSIDKKSGISLRNTHGNTISYIYSTMAIPATDTVNLISGKNDGGIISAVTVDSSLKTRASFNFSEDNSASDGNFKMLLHNRGYAIFNRQKCFFVNGELSKQWEISYNRNFKNAYSLTDARLVCALSDSGRTKLLCINSENGEVTWSKDFQVRLSGGQDLVVNKENNTIILAGPDSIWTLDFSGHEKQALNLNNDGFQVFDDMLTGKSYVFRNDKSFYW